MRRTLSLPNCFLSQKREEALRKLEEETARALNRDSEKEREKERERERQK